MRGRRRGPIIDYIFGQGGKNGGNRLAGTCEA